MSIVNTYEKVSNLAVSRLLCLPALAKFQYAVLSLSYVPPKLHLSFKQLLISTLYAF